MLDGLADRLGPVRFTVLHQFREASSCIETTHDVTWQRLVLPAGAAVGLVMNTAATVVGLRGTKLLSPVARSIVEAYRSADLVVSAPGGPYIGDVYWNHEPVHWFYIWLTRVHRRPIGLYATSAGPFRIRVFNPFRRLTYRCFDRLVLREAVSARHVRGLTRGRVELEVTADSALQERVPARPPLQLVGRVAAARRGDRGGGRHRSCVRGGPRSWRPAGELRPIDRGGDRRDRSVDAAPRARGVHAPAAIPGTRRCAVPGVARCGVDRRDQPRGARRATDEHRATRCRRLGGRGDRGSVPPGRVRRLGGGPRPRRALRAQGGGAHGGGRALGVLHRAGRGDPGAARSVRLGAVGAARRGP